MTNPAFLGQFPITAPDLAVTPAPGAFAVDVDIFMSETQSEEQNLLQDLGNRLIEMPGSNLDFGENNTRGVGLLLYLGATADKVQGLPSRIDAEFEQDPRVSASYTTIEFQADGADYFAVIRTQVTSVAGVFGFAWGWSQTGVTPLPTAGT